MPLTVKERAQAITNGINIMTAYNRIRRGWDRQRAVTEPVIVWREICNRNGINYSTFQSRRQYGWSLEDAATIPAERKYAKKMKTVKILKRKNGVASKIEFDGNIYSLVQPTNRKGGKRDD